MENNRAMTTTGGGAVAANPDFSKLREAKTLDDFIDLTNQVWEEWGKTQQIANYDRSSLLATWRGSPYYYQAAQQISRALRAGQVYSLTGKQWQETLDFFRGQCAYCGQLVDLLEMDHVFPFQAGGGFMAGNIVPSCMRCNRRKKANTLEECLNLRYISLDVYGKIMEWQRLQRRKLP